MIAGSKVYVEDDVARQHNADDDDANVSLAHGCLKLGDDNIEEDNNNFELQQRHRFIVALTYITVAVPTV